MNYSLVLTPRAAKELDNLKRSGQKKLVSKVADLMDELLSSTQGQAQENPKG